MTVWTQAFDFVNDGPQNWFNYPGRDYIGTHTPGQGWNSTAYFGAQYIYIERYLPQSISVTYVRVDCQRIGSGSGTSGGGITLRLGGAYGTYQHGIGVSPVPAGSPFTFLWSVAEPNAVAADLLHVSAYLPDTWRITGITVQGTGTNPFLTPFDWCHEFNFDTSTSALGWTEAPNYGAVWAQGEGWKEDNAPNPDQVFIRRDFGVSARITQVEYTLSTLMAGTFNGWFIAPGGSIHSSANVILQQANVLSRVFSVNQPILHIELGIEKDNVATPPPAYEGAIERVVLRGVGANPFNQEPAQQQALDESFEALRDALQANPNANVTTLTSLYKSTIQYVFGVTFLEDSGAALWNDAPIAVHFARLGLEAVAKAFEQWVEGETQGEPMCNEINRFDLFKRMMGNVRFRNVTTEEDFPAQNTQVGTERRIEVYQRPSGSGGGQWYMTPNNVIHELGHWFDNNSGFNFNKIGSLEYTITDTSKGGGSTLHDNFSRHGMAEGRLYLRTEFLEHHLISDSDSNNIPEYTNREGEQPIASDPDYSEFVPSRYLFYDVADNRFDVWRSPVYHNRYLNNARIDTLVQNDDADKTETTADAFLNWVRDQEYLREYQGVRSRRPFYNYTGETNATAWINFFTNNIGMFLRNATIYNYPGGMVQFYQMQSVIPSVSIGNATRTSTNYTLRLEPTEPPLGALEDPTAIAASGSLPPDNPIYGWLDAGGLLSDNISTYWLLIADESNRLVWIASNGIGHNPNILTSQNEVDPTPINPSRDYDDEDLSTIIGE